MKRLLNYTEWQSGSGKWYCGDVSDLSDMSNAWWYPMRMLDLSVEEYIKLIIDTYQAEVKYDRKSNVLHIVWEKQGYMRKFKNMVNREAKARKFFIG